MITPARTPVASSADRRWVADTWMPRGGAFVPRAKSVLLVEHRDEIAARLIDDLQEAGLTVRRATSGAGVAECDRHRAPDLLLTSSLLPDESGWLVAAKFRLRFRDPEIWLYSPWRPPRTGAFAEFVGVDRSIYYGGDLWRLSEDVRGLLMNSPPRIANVAQTTRNRSTPHRDGAI